MTPRQSPARGRDAVAARELTRLEKRLGYRFADRGLLERALTHASYAHEMGGLRDGEALEFLGDAVLGFLVAETLLRRFPEVDEGVLSKFKAFLVSRSNLAAVARRLDVGRHLRLGTTAEKGGGREKDSLLGDAMEAVLAAVHLDGGDGAARDLVERLLGAQIGSLDRVEVERQDFKTRLQEELQARGRPTPRYKVEAIEGPAHQPTFSVAVVLEEVRLARGKGGSKKEAEQKAAQQALRRVRNDRAKGAAGQRPPGSSGGGVDEDGSSASG